ncbi:hypothetical protein CLSAP_54630 [Clostridium saccharoperbutylacetonicum]|nr:hypothetical protein CLSAP_54630 [Clostridium saccharoperbutylacetonicum]
MYSFYAVRGWSLNELANLDQLERVFLHCAREEYYKEETAKYKAIFGGKQ